MVRDVSHSGTRPDLDRLLADGAFARTAAESIQALAAPSRLRILARLHDGPAAVGEIAEASGWRRPPSRTSCGCCATSGS